MDESISLRELVDVDIIQAIQDGFAKTVGVSSVIFLPDGDALTRFSNPTEFCSLIRSTKEGRRRCFQSFAEMSRKAAELSEPEIMYCFAYGAHFVAPIIIDGERKATMYAGQFRPEKFSPEQLKELEKIAVEIDLSPESLIEEAKNMRTVKEKVVWECLHSFFRTVKVIAELGAQALELRQTKDTLQKAHDELEMRVQERTTELTETNEELKREIAERKAAEEALRESEAKYRLFTETSKDAILSYDMDGRITYLNRAAIELGGYSEEEALQMNIIDILPRDQLSGFYKRFSMRAAGGSGIVLYEVDFINKSGERISVEVSSSMIAEDGKPAGLLLACRDITERKRAEDALRESEEKFRSIVEQSSDGIVLADEQGTIIEWNPGQERITGLSRAEVLGRPVWDVQFRMAANDRDTPAVYERVKAGVLKLLETGQSEWLDRLEEAVIKRTDGARRVIQAAVFPIKTGKGFMTGAISRDITECKQAEDALRKSEEKYRALFETAKDAIFLSDESGKFVDVNQAACESLGYSREELLRLSNREIDADPTGYEAFLKVRNTPAKEAIFEVNQHRKDGTLLPVEITGKFFETDGELLSLAIARDITERKKAEETVRVSEEKYKALYDNAPLSYQSLNEDGSFNDVNPAWIRTLGYGRKEVNGKWFGDFLHPDWKPHFEKNFQEFKRRGYMHDIQFKIRHKDGHYLDISFEGYIGYNPDGSFKQTYCVLQDITERKQAEEALRIERDNFINILESMDDGVYIVNQQYDIQYVNPVLKKDFGSVDGRKCYKYFHNLDEVCPWCKNRDVLTGKTVRWEWYSFKNRRTYDLIDTPLKNPDGSISKLEIFRDITERKQAEENLRESEARIRALLNAPTDAMILIDSAGIVLAVNNTHAKWFKKSIDELIGKCIFDLFPSDIAEFRKAQTNVVFNAGEPIRFEESHGEKIFNTNVYPVFGAKGKVTAVAVYAQDITERNQVEGKLKASQLKYRQLFETMTSGVAIYEVMDDGDDFIFRDFNRAGENIEKVKKEDVIGRRVTEAFPGVREFGLFKVFQRVWRTGKPEYFPEAIYRDEPDSGTWRENWVYKLPSGEIVAIYNDITERKQVEQSLLEAEAELKHIIEVVPGIIAKVNAHTGYFTYCNPALSGILGFSPEEFLARPFIEFVHPDDRQRTINEVEKQLKGSPLAMFENRYICKNGSYKWLEWRATAADENEVIYAAATDITERKAAEEQIKRSLQGKDVLMHEIYHRVKNNLQVASSLLSMQARTTGNKEAIDVLSKSQSRMNTMALIHTQLYESGDLSELNMGEFVGTLSEELFRSYPVTDTKITPIVHVTDRKFPASVGVYVGLIINELLGNALQHAFGERKEGKIEVSLTASDSGRVNLRVSDDGVGLPPGFDIDKTRSLGLHLVKILVEDQLQGKIEVISDGGVTFNMEFDIECNGGSSYGEDKNTDR